MKTVRDVMTQQVITVHPATPLKEVAQLLVKHRLSGLPVVDDEGAVVGVVSETDLLVKEQGVDAVPHRPLARFLGESRKTRTQLAKLEAITAGEAMTAPAVTISSERRISEAAAIMTSRGINRLPVVDDGRPVGIVTRADLIRAYVRTDDELAATIRKDVFKRILWLDPELYDIEVRDGVVAISGQVDRRATVETVERAVGMVPGVVGVRLDLTWASDDDHPDGHSIDPFFPFSPP